MYGAHHPKADVDRFYIKRSREGRRLIGVEDGASMEIHRLKDYLMSNGENLLEGVQNNGLFVRERSE